MPAVRPAIPDVITEAVEEIGLLGAQAELLRTSSEVPERRCAEIQARSDAYRALSRHDAVAGLAIAQAAIAEGRPPWILASAWWLWLDLAAPDPTALAERVQDAADAVLPDLRQACRWWSGCDRDQGAWLSEARRSDRPVIARHLLLDALGWRDAVDAGTWTQVARSDQAVLRWTAARHAGRVGAVDVLVALRRDPDPAIAGLARFGLCLADPATGLAEAGADDLGKHLVGLFGDAAARARIPVDHPAAAYGAAWAGPAEDTPMAWCWRRALAPGGAASLRRHLPPGLVGGDLDVAEPGT
jgi:hypothetical protein